MKGSEQLIGFACSETTIECSKCNYITGTQDDEDEAVKEFYKLGWRATDRNCYCPKCAKKYLKRKS